MMEGGEMKCADISAEEFAEDRLNRGEVLCEPTNSIEHVGKTGLFDLRGRRWIRRYRVLRGSRCRKEYFRISSLR